ncbi:Ctr copper transporter family-domain-containing protein [Catenaria anguillulae PL171]|uniref:Copper transport protein n=1 Tax=Catenaria anguillulae PL171 TaxID=765915 RepID=A0A1Y2I374_9FUNG|nr:Ctr copper transporter family-domain-containing protein [Catenaria anguillulae PL171]
MDHSAHMNHAGHHRPSAAADLAGTHESMPGMPGMDHGSGGSSGSMPGMDHSMMMQWNWATQHFSVVFSWWHVMSGLDFCLSLLAVFALAMLYERTQAERARLEYLASSPKAAALASRTSAAGGRRPRSESPHLQGNEPLLAGSSLTDDGGLPTPVAVDMPASTASVRSVNRPGTLTRTQMYYRTALMAASYFLSIFLMLIFMTYNGWIILAAVAGAATGFHQFRMPGSQFGLDKSCCD